MNTLVVLLMTCAPGVDPMPLAESVGSFNSQESGGSGRNSGRRLPDDGAGAGYAARGDNLDGMTRSLGDDHGTTAGDGGQACCWVPGSDGGESG
jgi:hypothetical protein